MEFQLGLWMHGYEWIDSPKPNYTIEGSPTKTHGPYCRDAVRALLKACPAISGVTFRVHGESGVEEGSYEFWKTVFEGVATCGRKVEIDMHAKGMDQTMIDMRRRHRHAGQDLAEILGRAHGHAVPPGRHPRAGAAQAGGKATRPDETQRRLAQFPALRLWRPAARGSAAGACCIASGPARSGCCCGAIR